MQKRSLCSVVRNQLLAFVICSAVFFSSAFALPAFPGAKGYGSTTVAGSGRHLSPVQTTVMKVTNLNDSGAGSLRACIEGSGPRVCVFETSGEMLASSHLVASDPYLTVAGQTAPSPGFSIRGYGIRVQTHDVLVQHLRIRVGDDPGRGSTSNLDAIQIYNVNDQGYNIVVDHMSLSWALDETLSTAIYGVRDVTVSNVLLAEPLLDSINTNGPSGYGMLINQGTFTLTMHHNLIAHASSRVPRFKAENSAEFVNNVIYNWGPTFSSTTNFSDSNGTGMPQFFNFAGNYYKPGPESGLTETIYAKNALNVTSRIYVEGNVGPMRPTDTEPQWNVVRFLPEAPYRSLTPVLTPSYSTTTAQEAYDKVIASVGARPAERDSTDARIINEVISGTGSRINCVAADGSERCQKNAGGWPTVAVNTRVLSVPNDPHGDQDADGYTNLEEWLHEYAAVVEGTTADTVPPSPPQIIGVTVFD